MGWLGPSQTLPLKIVRHFRLYFWDGLVFFMSFALDFFVDFCAGSDTDIGVVSAAGFASASTGISTGTYVLVLVVGIGRDSESQSPIMKIVEAGIAKTGLSALKIFMLMRYQKDMTIRKIPSRSLCM
jgi:hypothetical protein